MNGSALKVAALCSLAQQAAQQALQIPLLLVKGIRCKHYVHGTDSSAEARSVSLYSIYPGSLE